MFRTKTQMWCAWSGLSASFFFFAGLIIAGFLPVPGPWLSPAEVASIYQQNTSAIRIGMVIILVSGMFVIPLVALISIHLRRIEGTTPILSYIQLSAGSLNVMFFILPGLFFLITAFRPDRPPEITHMMNDACWMTTIMVWVPSFMQNMAIGFGILADKSAQPIFPRWVAFFNFWVAILFLPGTLLAFFKTGPFAWNGLIAFWIPATAFGIWFLVMPIVCMRATKRQALGITA